MKEIKLTQNQVALVDNSDFLELNKYKWFAHFKNGWYAVRNVSKNGIQTQVKMHRVILNVSKNMQIDHIDGNGLNNQRKNLRICTNSQNQKNKGSYRNNTSGFKGVSWHKIHKKWNAKISVDGKRISLGDFSTKEEAYQAYCIACAKYHGEFSKF
jgi:hypothetical protein